MKFLILAVALFAVGATADPAPSAVYTEEYVLKNIEQILQSLQRNNELSRREEEKILGGIALRSIDKHCMYNQYKERELFRFFNEELIEDGRLHDEDAKAVFASTMLFCFNKIDVLAEFVFENVRSYFILYNAIKDEQSLRNYTNYVYCANKYALNNHYFDDTVYGHKVKVADDNDGSCLEITEVFKAVTSTVKLGLRRNLERTCVISLLNHVERVVAREILLIQFDLTVEQRNQERQYFLSEVHKFLEEVLSCAAGYKTEMSRELYRTVGRF